MKKISFLIIIIILFVGINVAEAKSPMGTIYNLPRNIFIKKPQIENCGFPLDKETEMQSQVVTISTEFRAVTRGEIINKIREFLLAVGFSKEAVVEVLKPETLYRMAPLLYSDLDDLGIQAKLDRLENYLNEGLPLFVEDRINIAIDEEEIDSRIMDFYNEEGILDEVVKMVEDKKIQEISEVSYDFQGSSDFYDDGGVYGIAGKFDFFRCRGCGNIGYGVCIFGGCLGVKIKTRYNPTIDRLEIIGWQVYWRYPI